MAERIEPLPVDDGSDFGPDKAASILDKRFEVGWIRIARYCGTRQGNGVDLGYFDDHANLFDMRATGGSRHFFRHSRAFRQFIVAPYARPPRSASVTTVTGLLTDNVTQSTS